MRRSWLLLSLALAGCGRAASDDASIRTDDANVVVVPPGDAEMAAATERARATTGELIRRIEQPPATQTTLSVKVRLDRGADSEHMWMERVRVVDGRLVGILSNQPVMVRDRNAGDTLSVLPSEISDWMAVDGGRMCGGYTILRALRDMAPAERAAREAAMGLTTPPTDGSC
jgi:uncharacterized protein YegJ (DUF2314 family)